MFVDPAQDPALPPLNHPLPSQQPATPHQPLQHNRPSHPTPNPPNQVGGRSVVNSDITQIVEIRPEADRFLRLLELLGEWYELGKVLVFVHSQDKCDTLFRDLLKVR